MKVHTLMKVTKMVLDGKWILMKLYLMDESDLWMKCILPNQEHCAESRARRCIKSMSVESGVGWRNLVHDGGRIHFHPKTFSSTDTFIQKRFHPMTLSSKRSFIQ